MQILAKSGAALLLVSLLLCACTTAGGIRNTQSSEPASAEPTSSASDKRYALRRSGTLNDPRAGEVSGLAVSNLSDDRLWMVNDSGNSASLLAYSQAGAFQAAVPVTTGNRDWESLGSFRLDDDAYLLVADTGDNLKSRAHYSLSLFAEPEVGRQTAAGNPAPEARPVSVIRFVYPDGKHNCEAVAVSVTDQSVILVTKSDTDPGIYSLPLQMQDNDSILTATRTGTLPRLPKSLGDQFIESLVGVDLSQATGLDINREDNLAFLLTYRGVFRWVRKNKEQDWGTVMSGQPEQITRHSLAQAEALAFSNHTGSVYFVSERTPSPILQLAPLTP